VIIKIYVYCLDLRCYLTYDAIKSLAAISKKRPS